VVARSDDGLGSKPQLVLLAERTRAVGRGKREPGESPGLPRSGEWERPPSYALGGMSLLGSDGQ